MDTAFVSRFKVTCFITGSSIALLYFFYSANYELTPRCPVERLVAAPQWNLPTRTSAQPQSIHIPTLPTHCKYVEKTGVQFCAKLRRIAKVTISMLTPICAYTYTHGFRRLSLPRCMDGYVRCVLTYGVVSRNRRSC